MTVRETKLRQETDCKQANSFLYCTTLKTVCAQQVRSELCWAIIFVKFSIDSTLPSF